MIKRIENDRAYRLFLIEITNYSGYTVISEFSLAIKGKRYMTVVIYILDQFMDKTEINLITVKLLISTK